MKKVTFPHMGNLNIPLKAFLREMQLEIVEPPKNSKKTLDLGVKYSPEFACLPLKYNIGNFIQALEKGANIILMGGGVGPCRFGYYCEVQKEILRDLGYEFKMINLEPDFKQTFFRLRRLFGGIKVRQLYRGGKLAWKKVINADRVRELVFAERAREKVKGKIDRIYESYLSSLDEITIPKKVEKITEEYIGKIRKATGEYRRGMKIRIGLVGEIYMLLEPFANLDIARKLGTLGASVERKMSLSHWLRSFLNLDDEEERISVAAENYLETPVGGHGQMSVGKTVEYARTADYDGVIHLSPFTCMPEIVAQMILPEISEKENVPVLSLIFDEHTGEAGLNTRLEAFIDMIYRNKIKEKGVVNV
ncbi:MAG: 2-hydroxyacyl-CoA dehydratase [Halanaerobiaceae bacterium]